MSNASNNLPAVVTGQLVREAPDGRLLVKAGLHNSDIGIVASYSLDGQAGRVRAASLLSQPVVSLMDLGEAGVMQVVSITAEPCEWEDEQGELIQTLRIIFELPDGKLVQTHANTIMHCLKRLIFAYPPPWTNPITLHYKRGLSPRKRPIYSLWLDPNADVATQPIQPSPKHKK